MITNFINFSIFIVLFCIGISYCDLPSLYDYYGNNIKSGLTTQNDQFTLNGKEIRILSGSMHYFRVVPEYWSDRLFKMKAAGLNAVQFYLPWNLHEEIPGEFNFEGILNLTKFLNEIKKADMFAIVRPGPYICAEWEYGGLPSWLLRDPNMKVRSNYAPYKNAIEKYFQKVIPLIKDYQFSTNGGPIIAVQIENEFASYGNTKTKPDDLHYMNFVKDTVINYGIKELLFTSDNTIVATQDHGSIPGILMTVNLNHDPKGDLTILSHLQPHKPLYVAEFWSGWFDHWGEKHHTVAIEEYTNLYETIVLTMNASANIYMFHGGTNFGFMNGANIIFEYTATVTSYDYDAPLSESGDYTDKYWKTKSIIEKLQKNGKIPMIKIPPPPPLSAKIKYGIVNVTHFISFESMLNMIKPIVSEAPIPMEMLNIGTNYGQNFGFTLYRTSVPKFQKLHINGKVNDRIIIYIDNKNVTIVEVTHSDKDMSFDISKDFFDNKTHNHILDIFVENTGRINFAFSEVQLNNQRKGINAKVCADNNVIKNWKIYPIDFRHDFLKNLKEETLWKPQIGNSNPAIHRATLTINEHPKDTFLKIGSPWTKGVVFVNGFNIGRYWNWGPQRTLYVPAPLLRMGHNDIYIFELQSSGNSIELIEKPIL